jgi:hypothetical protein
MKSFKIPKGQQLSIYRRTENAMAKGKSTKELKIYDKLHDLVNRYGVSICVANDHRYVQCVVITIFTVLSSYKLKDL